jgi:hypothetical protein
MQKKSKPLAQQPWIEYFPGTCPRAQLPEELQHEQRLLVRRLERAPALWEIPRK